MNPVIQKLALEHDKKKIGRSRVIKASSILDSIFQFLDPCLSFLVSQSKAKKESSNDCTITLLSSFDCSSHYPTKLLITLPLSFSWACRLIFLSTSSPRRSIIFASVVVSVLSFASHSS
jgi:hypothetical protein